jgi:UrcA family protein
MSKLHTGIGVAAAALAIAALAGAGSAQAQPYGYDDPDYAAAPPPAYDADATVGGLTIYAPRSYERSAIGAPIETVRESRVVPTDDLDLDTGWGAHVLRVRIQRAAGDACRDLDYRYPAAGAEGPDCYRTAVRHAMYETVDRLGYVPPTW